MPVTFYYQTGQSLYVRFDNSASTAVNLTEGASLAVGKYVAADSAIVTAGLARGNYSARICVGTAAGQANTDLVVGTLPQFYWSGLVEVTKSVTVPSAQDLALVEVPGLVYWLEPRLGGLFQDSAGTATPATANNDPIGFIPDLSGNGFNATQATAGNRPLYQTAGLSSAYPSALFDGTNDNWTLGSTVGNVQANGCWTRIYVPQPAAIDGFRIMGYKAGPVSDDIIAATTLFPSGTVGARIIRDAYSGSSGIGPGAIVAGVPYFVAIQQKPVYLGNGTTASNTMRVYLERIWINGYLASESYQTVTAWSTGTEWTIGGAGASFPFTGNMALVCAYAGDISEEQLNLLGTYVTKNYGISIADHRPPARTGLPIGTVFVGDSLTKGIGASGHPWPLIVSRLLADKFVTVPHNFGISGLNTVDADSNLRPVMVPGENIAVVFLGTNPLGSGTAAATAYSQLVTKCQEIQALGMKVIVLTLPDRNAGFSGGIDTASFETARQTFNTSVRTNYATFADALVDIGLDGTQVINGVTHDFSALGDASAASDTNYFTDGTHLAISSHYIIASAVADTIRVLVGDTTNLANRTTIVALPADAAAGANGGLPTVDASNRIAGIAGTLNTLDALDTAQDAEHSITQGTLATVATTSAEAAANSSAGAIRNALGLAAANIDTQLNTLPTAAENAAAVIGATAAGSAGTVGKILADYAAVKPDATIAAADDVSAGGTVIPVNQVVVPASRTWLLKATDDGLLDEESRTMKVGESKAFAIDFREDLPTNGRLDGVDAIAIETGTSGGVTFAATANDPGVDKTQARVTITAVTAGSYEIACDVSYSSGDGGGTATGVVTLIVTD